MHPDTPLKTAGVTESPPQWAAAEAADLQHPEDSGLAQSLRFYVAHANAGIRNMCESPATSDIFRYPPESRTAAAVALAADKEDRLLHLLRGYGCAVILANLITTFLCSTLTRNIHIIPAEPATSLEEALARPLSVLITVTTVLFEDGLTGARLAEWELWGEQGTAPSAHALLGEALHAADAAAAAAAPAAAAEPGDNQTTATLNPLGAADNSTEATMQRRRLADALIFSVTTPLQQQQQQHMQQLQQLQQQQQMLQTQQLHPASPHLFSLSQHAPLVHAHAAATSEHSRLLGGPSSFVLL
ncbi:hypothetical protein, conserved [Eimeria acervulina]|uniref:Uncharacterized protein n=1 Tax=Eimeria acervulina TaxID=5801 RepID=U6GHL6_EIMAC|nr:hypothetical protein, conserved [Eimeria acervulina]CDI78064.1 hypothetical protein, conserved [Eimeria acervulina]